MAWGVSDEEHGQGQASRREEDTPSRSSAASAAQGQKESVEMDTSVKKHASGRMDLYNQSRISSSSLREVGGGAAPEPTGNADQFPFLILNPRTTYRLFWDILMMSLLLWSAIVVPWRMAFGADQVTCNNPIYYQELAFDILFLMDVVLIFRTAYYDESQHTANGDALLVTSGWLIAKHYVNPRELNRASGGGWFFVDIIGSIPLDTALCFMDESFGFTRVAKAPRLLKVIRILRLLRLIRLGRLARIARKIRDSMKIQPGLISLIRFCAIVALIAHWVACLWFFIGTLVDDDEKLVSAYLGGSLSTFSWLGAELNGNGVGSDVAKMAVRCQRFNGEKIEPSCQEVDPETQYIVSLYWASTTLSTVGYGDITGYSLPAVGFSIFVTALGGFLFAYMVGNIAILLDKLDTKATKYRSIIYEAESFMHRERMPLQLKTTIRSYLSKTFLNQRYVPSYISELSGSLKREMYLTLFKDLIVKVPFFSDWSNTAITEIVEHFRLKVLPAEEVLYREGDIGDRMYFLHTGKIMMSMPKESKKGKGAGERIMIRSKSGRALQGDDKNGGGAFVKWIVGQGSFFGENAVIGNKMRITTAKAVEWCNIYYITLDDIEDTIRKYSRAAISFKVYKSNMRTEANARLQKIRRAALMIGKKKASDTSALARPPSPTPDADKPASVQKEDSGVGDAYEGDVIALDLNPAAMSMDSPEPATQASKEDGAAHSRRQGAGEQTDGKGEAKSEIQGKIEIQSSKWSSATKLTPKKEVTQETITIQNPPHNLGLAIEQVKDVNKIMWQDVQNWKEHDGMLAAVAEQYAVKVAVQHSTILRLVKRIEELGSHVDSALLEDELFPFGRGAVRDEPNMRDMALAQEQGDREGSGSRKSFAAMRTLSRSLLGRSTSRSGAALSELGRSTSRSSAALADGQNPDDVPAENKH